MAEEFLRTLLTLVDVMIAPTNAENGIDLYCKGMFFGLNGSLMMVKFANALLSGLSFDEIRKKERELAEQRKNPATGGKRFKKGGEIDLWKTITTKIAEIAKAVIENDKTDDL